MEKLALRIEDISETTGQPVRQVFDAIRVGHLETFVVGRRRFARPEAVRRWVEFLEGESRAGRPVKYLVLRGKVAA